MIIAIAGQKGGAGKSTVATNLAAEGLARGLRVLLVDADPQGTSRTWAATALEAGHPAPSVVAMEANLHSELPRAVESFDLAIIDCPPRHGEVQRSALLASNVALIPCGPSAADAWALATTLDVLTEARKLRAELLAAIVISRQRPRTHLGKTAREVFGEAGIPLLATELADRVAYPEAMAAGQGVVQYAPEDLAATEVRALFDELVKLVSPPAPGGKKPKKKRP